MYNLYICCIYVYLHIYNIYIYIPVTQNINVHVYLHRYTHTCFLPEASRNSDSAQVLGDSDNGPTKTNPNRGLTLDPSLKLRRIDLSRVLVCLYVCVCVCEGRSPTLRNSHINPLLSVLATPSSCSSLSTSSSSASWLIIINITIIIIFIMTGARSWDITLLGMLCLFSRYRSPKQ